MYTLEDYERRGKISWIIAGIGLVVFALAYLIDYLFNFGWLDKL